MICRTYTPNGNSKNSSNVWIFQVDYMVSKEIMQTYDAHQLNHNQAAEIDNLIWYFSELFKRN